MARIGVEPGLEDIKQELAANGHEVVDLRSEADTANCDCCIISGMDKDLMGISDAVIAGPVINAQGQNAEDVLNMVNERYA
ncbi:YkuS family protein [Virgibacillus sp. 179-BFC.A HS]|uniref:YkuS family protein n=1 Tax=Tigheibacillus jepli TaxID=3035914 RepID=A0ABU5CKI6_9BACI|nr:YkuS family protein [Virgibacillus sp. 179-BFC.A HS]MDY0406028.1 YkuS family protein [Virgibacillus sp. 179-BFC.A HS]